MKISNEKLFEVNLLNLAIYIMFLFITLYTCLSKLNNYSTISKKSTACSARYGFKTSIAGYSTRVSAYSSFLCSVGKWSAFIRSLFLIFHFYCSNEGSAPLVKGLGSEILDNLCSFLIRIIRFNR